MVPVPALSTSWCSHRHKDGYEMLQEMAGLGFSRVELSHGIRISLVPGIIKAAEEGLVQVGSVHNFCPLPMGVFQASPNFFQPSSPDARERDQWVRQTKKTLDFAAQLGASLVVCHLGSVRYLWLPPDRGMEAYRKAHPEPAAVKEKAYQTLLEKALKKVRGRMPPYLQNVKDSLSEVLDYAAERKIRLGLENRERFEELPLDADFPALLKEIGRPETVGYWHDAGHADLKERMGVIDHRRQLEDNAGRLFGFHLHDVGADEKDHSPIGAGTIDFGMVSSFFRPEHLFVIELSPRVSADGVAESKLRIEQLLAALAPSVP